MPRIDSARFGKAVEHLVASSCILASDGELNVSTALVDDEGGDMVFHRRDGSATLAVQVKSRATDARTITRGTFLTDVRSQTFRPRRDLYFLGVVVDPQQAAIPVAWLIPSTVLAERVAPNRRGRMRFAASLKPGSRDRWRPYRLEQARLPARVLEILAELEAPLS